MGTKIFEIDEEMSDTVLRLVVYPVRSHRIVGSEFGLFPGSIRGIHFELQRPKYFVNLYIVCTG